MNVALYLRQSLDRAGDELAVARQEEEARALASSRGWTITATFSDNDTSATSGKARPGFEALLASEPEGILVWHQDRLVRLTRDLERVLDLEVPVFTVAGGDLDLSTPAGRAVARTVVAWSTYEGEQRTLRQKAAARQHAAAGKPWWPTRPFGLTHDGTALVEEEAAAIREAYARVLNGGAITHIVRDWNERGLTTTVGKPWTSVGVRALLVNPRNAARRIYRGQDVGKAMWPEVVDEGTFYAALAVLSDPKRGKGGSPRKHLLTGLAKCSECGTGMTASTVGKGVRSYRCPKLHMSTNAETLEQIVREKALVEYAASDSRVLEPRRAQVDTDALVADERALTERLDGLADAYATGAVTLQQLTRATAAIEAQIEAVRAKLAEAPTDLQFSGMTLGELRELLSNPTTARSALDRFEVVVHPIRRGTRRTPDSVDVTLAQ